MSEDEDRRGSGREAYAYAQSPRPVGMPVAFRLHGRVLEVERPGRIDRLPLERLDWARLTFEPRSFAPGQLKARLQFSDGRYVIITNIDYRSMVDARRMDAEYGRFLRELLARAGRAAPQAAFIAGRPALLWWITAIVAGLIVLAVTVAAWEAWRLGQPLLAGAALLVAALGVWQLEPMVRLNRPGRFDPADPPATLAPRG